MGFSLGFTIKMRDQIAGSDHAKFKGVLCSALSCEKHLFPAVRMVVK
jgi:hypothetical protein